MRFHCEFVLPPVPETEDEDAEEDAEEEDGDDCNDVDASSLLDKPPPAFLDWAAAAVTRFVRTGGTSAGYVR